MTTRLVASEAGGGGESDASDLIYGAPEQLDQEQDAKRCSWRDSLKHGRIQVPDVTVQLTAGGGGAVASVFGRTGAVVATTSDYTSRK